MTTEDDPCAGERQLRQIDEAFKSGDLDALRRAVDDPAIVPNGRMPDTIGPCLVYAVYHSPVAFIRTLLELGANPNEPADDGFPPIIAALSSGQRAPGLKTRHDVPDIIRLLLAFGSDPNQRGINDYTPLHMAVATGNALAVQILLDGGADPGLRTRIDDHETPGEMARSAGWTEIAAILDRKGQPLRQRLRSGLVLLADIPGEGEPVRRQHNYRIRLKLWLNRGDAVRWPPEWGTYGAATIEDNGETLINEIRIDRRSLVNGLLYGMDGMRVGGMRRLEIAPHLAYGDRGIPGVIPAGAVLVAEVSVIGVVGAAAESQD